MAGNKSKVINALAVRRETLDGKANVRIGGELLTRLDAACKALDDMPAAEFVRRAVRRWKSGKLIPVVVPEKTKNGTTAIFTIKNWAWPEITDNQLREIITAQVEEIERHPPPARQKFTPPLVEGLDYVVEPEIMD